MRVISNIVQFHSFRVIANQSTDWCGNLLIFQVDFTIFSDKRQSSFPFSRENSQGSENMKEKEEPIITDPFGSYTGLVKDPEEKPVQDADDL